MTTETLIPFSAELAADQFADLGFHMRVALARPEEALMMCLERGASYAWGPLEDRNPAWVAESGRALWDEDAAERAVDWWWLGEDDEW